MTAGLWDAAAYLEFAASGSYVAASDDGLHLLPNESAGRYPGVHDTWAIYWGSQLTPGRMNPVPLPAFSRPWPAIASMRPTLSPAGASYPTPCF